MARSYDWQRIRTHRPYTLKSLGDLYGVHPATVRRWIKVEGLSVAIVGTGKPVILNGKSARDWMRKREAARKQPCGPDEVYCVACKSPRPLSPGTARIVAGTAPKINVEGACTGCGRTLRRFDTEANRAALEARFGLIMPRPT